MTIPSRRRATRSSRGRSTCRRRCRSTRRRLDGLDSAKIFAAPDDPADWPAWREALHALARRGRARGSATTAAPTSAPELAWTQRCFSVALVWLWDELLYDHAARRFTPDRFCAEAEREFGGFDGVVLWHAYPVIGIDERNQFDFYRDVPGLARARRRLPGARRPRVRRLQPVGRRHAPRAGRRRRGDRGGSSASSAPTASSSTR